MPDDSGFFPDKFLDRHRHSGAGYCRTSGYSFTRGLRCAPRCPGPLHHSSNRSAPHDLRSFGLGADGDNSYELTISNSTGQTKQTLPFVHGDFKEATRLVVFSPDKGDGNYYLDAISLKTDRKER